MFNVTGIVLSSVRLNEKKSIYTIYTKEEGKISVSAYTKKSNTISVLSICQFTLKKPIHSDIYTAKEWSLKSALLPLREGFSLIQYAQKMCLTLNKSQCDQVKKPHLYQLLEFFLLHLPKITSVENGLCCFYAKLLHAEGVLNPETIETVALVKARQIHALNSITVCEETQKSLSSQIENNFF